MTSAGLCAIGLDELIDYFVGELAEERAQRVEEHVFTCEKCARSFENVDLLRRALEDTVRCAEIGCNVGSRFLERAVRDGLSLKEYLIPEGGTVTCHAGPDDFVVVRLSGDFDSFEELALGVDVEDLEAATTTQLPERTVVVDRDLDQVLLVFPGKLVRTYPRSRWTLRLTGHGSSGPAVHGPFVMDHHP